MFIVTVLTAIGTCGVTILNIFPFRHRDKIEAEVIFKKKMILIIIKNKTNHTIYMGADKHAFCKYPENYGLWWPNEKQFLIPLNNPRHLLTNPGDNLAVPPRSTIFYVINPRIFGKNPLDKLKIQVMTSSGYKFDVKNKLKSI